MRNCLLCLALVLTFSAGCKKSASTTTDSNSTTSEDSSATGIAAAAVGGTLLMLGNGVNTTLGFQPPDKTPPFLRMICGEKAFAASACPTFMSNPGSGCSNSSGTAVTLNYSGCSFGSSTATWTGTDSLNVTSGTIQCGSYPTIPSSPGMLAHGYTGLRTASSGTIITATIDLTNYTGSNVGNQWEQVRFTGGALSTVIISGVRFKSNSPSMDYTLGQYLSTGLTVGTTATSKTLSGSINVYGNNNKVTGRAIFSNVVYSNSCCQPTGGAISTTFAAGTNGTPGSTYDGQTESMSFSGTCGEAQYTGISGTTKTVNLVHCL